MNRRTFLGVAGCGALGIASAPLFLLGRDIDPNGAKIMFGGDTCHGESYPQGGGNILAERGYAHSLEALAPLVRRSDYAIVNLETPITMPIPEFSSAKDYVHWSDPQSLVALATIGIDAVSLANNHTLDYGKAGLAETFRNLDRNGIKYFGAGDNLARAAAPLVLNLPSPSGFAKAAVIGLFEYRRIYDEQHGFYAGPDAAGTNRLDLERFAQQAQRLREQIPGITIIACPHWGVNYGWRSRAQRDAGRALIDAGADMVIGHHAHTMQEIERYRDKWILYGIGNFMFNAPGRFAEHAGVLPMGLAVELNLTGSGDMSAKLYPIDSDNRRTDFRPQFVPHDRAVAALAMLLGRSNIDASREGLMTARDEIGTYLQIA